jgi:hypothetical protein
VHFGLERGKEEVLHFCTKMERTNSMVGLDDSWTIDVKDLVFKDIIGSGSFGVVREGQYIGESLLILSLFILDEWM